MTQLEMPWLETIFSSLSNASLEMPLGERNLNPNRCLSKIDGE